MKQTKISKKFQKVIDFYNETDQDQKIFFIYLVGFESGWTKRDRSGFFGIRYG